MNTISTFFMILLIGVGCVVLIPVFTFGLGALLWFLPILIIGCSNKTSGVEKAAWILSIVFLSWFAWVFYYFLAPLNTRTDTRDNASYYASTRERRRYRY